MVNLSFFQFCQCHLIQFGEVGGILPCSHQVNQHVSVIQKSAQSEEEDGEGEVIIVLIYSQCLSSFLKLKRFIDDFSGCQ